MDNVAIAKTFLKEKVNEVDSVLPDKLAAAVVVGLILNALLTVLSFIYDHFIKGTGSIKRYGKWAVVTGATDGIGLAMATEFAKKGLNVALVSRTQKKLDDCAEELKSKFPSIEVKTLAVDFSTINDPKVQAGIAKFMEPLEVGILVNNVGVSYPFAKYFHELKDEEVEALNTVNMDATIWMTRIALNQGGMLSRKKGAVVNVSSVAGVLCSPLLAQYGGAKGGVAQFTKAMHYEYSSKGIYFQCQIPFYVTTKLAKLRKASLMVASQGGYAKAAIKSLGNKTGVIVSPFWSHAVQLSALSMLPESVQAAIINMSHQGIRKAGLKKEARLAEEKKKGK
jgi:17beta-estradiol 17-dehydrogenase / very-long-chain 3-oxoacyl-CoA reductase